MTLFPILLALLIAAILLVLLYIYLIRPLQRLRELTRALAEGRRSYGYIATGILGIGEIIQNLEMIDVRISHLRYHVSTEKYNLDAILKSMVEGVMVVDKDGVIKLANDELRRFFKLTQSPLEQTVIEALRHADVHLVIQAAARSKERVTREIEIDTVVGDKEQRRILEMNAMPLHNPGEGSHGVVAVFHDLTRLKQLEEVRKEFVSNVSHELRTPLAIFKGYLETLVSNPNWLTPDAHRICSVLQRHSDRLNSLVNDLLQLTRMESGTFVLNTRNLELQTFLQEVVSDWEQAYQNKPCTLHLVTNTSQTTFHADPFRLEQVLNNLLENALKYSKPNGSVTVGVQDMADSSTLEFFVRDEGIGIPKDKLPHIFERFYRADTSRSREMGGTGLGLSIAKHIIQLHGGTIRAESEMDHGTTIYFTIPPDQSS